MELSRRERAETWVFTGPPGRVLSLSVDLALALPLLAAYGARRAWEGLRRGRPVKRTP
jgi:hypothetical protein